MKNIGQSSGTAWGIEFFSNPDWKDIINFLKEERLEEIKPTLRHINASIEYFTTSCTYKELGESFGVSSQRARQLAMWGCRVIRGQSKYLLMYTYRWERYQKFRKLCTLSGFEDHPTFLDIYRPIREKMDKVVLHVDDILYLDKSDIQELYNHQLDLVDCFMTIQTTLMDLMNQPFDKWKSLL